MNEVEEKENGRERAEHVFLPNFTFFLFQKNKQKYKHKNKNIL